ncbi:MAG: hypothetical protein K9W45_09080 [Candidatus Heimdallarchaeum aukensis]|uniref:Uncharacterized protein n=1 Tax=Candidatus Heimdallarchaeum aukensis TaxID=2876573 RepID=A0A9Y1BJQ5_9ARCH|nr:MAG: hypothetical protein K9W45_09080 [Candidatus Heimdallarchaeum aukensis]
MTVSERGKDKFFSNIYYDFKGEKNRTLADIIPFEFEAVIQEEHLIAIQDIRIKAGIKYHLHIKSLETDQKLQGVDLLIRKRGEKIVFTLSHRMKKLFKKGEKVKVSIFCPTEDFYGFYGRKQKEGIRDVSIHNDEILCIAFIYQMGENKRLISLNSENEEYLSKLEGIQETFRILDDRIIRRDEEGNVPFEAKSYSNYAIVRYYTIMNRYDFIKNQENHSSVYTYFVGDEKILPTVTSVKACLVIVINKSLIPICLEERVRKEINMFLDKKMPLFKIQDQLYELKRVILQCIRAYYRPPVAEETYNEFNIKSMLFHLNRPTSPVYKAIISLISFDNYISVEKLVKYVEKRYKIKDRRYISESLTELINLGIIKRKVEDGKVGVGVVRSYDEKR